MLNIWQHVEKIYRQLNHVEVNKLRKKMKKIIRGSKAAPFSDIEKIVEASRMGKLVVVIGAGVSVGLTGGHAPTWSRFISNGFKYALKKGRLTEAQSLAWQPQLASSDIDDLLCAAEFIGRKLKAPPDQIYARWLEEEFCSLEVTNSRLQEGLRALRDLQVPICTLNYDSLLEEVTELPGILVSDTGKVAAWTRRELPAILHLHGSWDSPGSCVVGVRDYHETQVNETRDFFQRHLAIFNHILFIGCGDTFSDPNFSALIAWLRTKFNALTPQHIALTLESEVSARNADVNWAGFVEPMGYGNQHEDLGLFLVDNFSNIKIRRVTGRKTKAVILPSQVLENYRTFLLKDCGQMTIEGVSADMDTGQRRFDLERLFVPLKIAACPPEMRPNDPDKDAKLERWTKKNKDSLSFGRVFAKGKSLALLALPGAGKTLLLKRLAVAYADPSRRSASTDELPDLDLIPVLIRCREWRDHIRLPIYTLLKNIADITGQSNLSGLVDALVPFLKAGKVLILVDGLDEIHNDADRTTFVEHLEVFLEEYRLTRMVITSREAGFNLVAPSLSRFCERWRLAPLEDTSVVDLCVHWHRLMIGDTPAALTEGQEVASTLLRNFSLRRLAENPLLLTMLLVVKHGAGGLPPDRVSLYSRAVEVLLDTWNIKGHEPLNAREAVPQLSYVALRLMKTGKQTATEKELIALLEEARDNLPHIRRYAKDSPHAFLKRVELRSSLLLEAGHQMEGGRTVPFYQFRHLTFQEYLSAVAVTEGHYEGYQQSDTILTPLENNLISEEWKEVVPMVAVLAKKRAEPLILALIAEGKSFQEKIFAADKAALELAWGDHSKLPPVAGRLLQCLIEEAEASPSTLSSALQLIAFFGQGCRSKDDWNAICRGPYGQELYTHAWTMFKEIDWPRDSWLMNTCASVAVNLKPRSYWEGEAGQLAIQCLLQGKRNEDIGQGLLICMGLVWNSLGVNEKAIFPAVPLKLIEKLLFHKNPGLQCIATWTWTNIRRRDENRVPVSVLILDQLMLNLLNGKHLQIIGTAAYALSCQIGIDRSSWTPVLTKTLREKFDSMISRFEKEGKDAIENNVLRALFFIAYQASDVWNDAQLRDKIGYLEAGYAKFLSPASLQAIRASLNLPPTPSVRKKKPDAGARKSVVLSQ